MTTTDSSSRGLLTLGIATMLVNLCLMLVKLITGIVGRSNALVADGIESAADVVVSLLTWLGVSYAQRPPDSKHPFGHGRMESLAGMFSGVGLMGAAFGIGFLSIRELPGPHEPPAWYTLPVLIGVVAVKWVLARTVSKEAAIRESPALEGDAVHHLSDALTSAAASVGITLALLGGERFHAADDWGALAASIIIFVNGGRIVYASLQENLDGRVDTGLESQLREKAFEVEGVLGLDKCLVRKSGPVYFAELHVEVDPLITVQAGHEIGHDVKDHLLRTLPKVGALVVHLEPFESPES